jgi:hypothetical protein
MTANLFCCLRKLCSLKGKLHPIKELLRIECAGGKELPYEGFIEVDLTILGSRGTHSKDSKLHKVNLKNDQCKRNG